MKDLNVGDIIFAIGITYAEALHNAFFTPFVPGSYSGPMRNLTIRKLRVKDVNKNVMGAYSKLPTAYSGYLFEDLTEPGKEWQCNYKILDETAQETDIELVYADDADFDELSKSFCVLRELGVYLNRLQYNGIFKRGASASTQDDFQTVKLLKAHYDFILNKFQNEFGDEGFQLVDTADGHLGLNGYIRHEVVKQAEQTAI